jgi:hypothetical protein
MRIALVTAVLAGCLAVPALAVMPTAQQLAITDPGFRLHAIATPQSMKPGYEEAHRLRFERKMLEYYPLGQSGLHLEAGFQREKAGINMGRAFNFRGDRLFGLNNLGFRRKVSPGFAVAYDEPVSAHDKFNLDVGMRYSRNAMASQLNRLAALGPEQYRLGAKASRFGPAAHLSFIHSF